VLIAIVFIELAVRNSGHIEYDDSLCQLQAAARYLPGPALLVEPRYSLNCLGHWPVHHVEVVEAPVETLSFRHICVVTEEYAVSKDGMKMFSVLDLDTDMPGLNWVNHHAACSRHQARTL
jgi:hypothetical protein